MSNFKPKETSQKILLSTTSRFVGEYETDDFLITHAFSNFGKGPNRTLIESPLSRNALVFAFEVPTLDKKEIILPDYSEQGEILCAFLSILFGKRFDNHGLIESHGLFRLPHMEEYSSFCNPILPHNNHVPRVNFSVELNLKKIACIEPLILQKMNPKFLNFFRTTSRFYLEALQNAETHPESAYLNLITCGEVLSNYFDYEKDNLLDDKTKAIFQTIIDELEEGQKIANKLKQRMLQIKKRFVTTITNFLDDSFFDLPKDKEKIYSLRKEDIEKNVGAAYDLRSKHLHTGISFGTYTACPSRYLTEVQLGKPVLDDKEAAKIIAKAPTFLGLERIMRYCLLQFLQSEGVIIDCSSNENNK